ncbi:MAG: FAD-dependent monooxygenase, partial [Actinomycetota bacterium]|nr:FAD-dependent monooxygenase [Actinomycetota bacterium]
MGDQREYDVAIVGGSIAGCTAATLFGRAGRKVALIESHPDINAYKKLCTTQILASATPTLQRLGLDRPIEDAGGIRNSFEIWTRRGWVRDPAYGSGTAPYGYSIRREKLDPMLRRMAGTTPGVDLLLGNRARKLLTADDGKIAGVTVEDREGNSRDIMARLVVGADGRNSPTAEMAGVRAARWK